MRRITKSVLAVGAAGAWSVGIAVAAQAAAGDKVLICHGSASDTNPYVLISVSTSALAGHLDRENGVDVSAHGQRNHEDFLPGPDATDCVGAE